MATFFDGVFEGGGAKGAAFVGALDAMEKHTLWFQRVAGTSAGSIVAALVAAGYRVDSGGGETIKDLLAKTPFEKFKDAPSEKDFSEEVIRSSYLYDVFKEVNLPFIPDWLEEKA